MADKNSTKKGDNISKMFKWLVFCLIFANLFVWLAAAQNSQKYLEVSYFDVGQGDAAFIQAPNGVQILIDGGPGNAVSEKLGNAMPFYDRDIDWLVLSHPDRDHLSGLLGLLKNYRVHNVLWSGIPKDTGESAEWLDLVAKENANIVTASAGEIFDLGGQPRLVVEILAPASDTASENSQSNESSVAARLVYGQRSFVFTGDAGQQEEQIMIDSDPGLKADVLKVAHHGSKNSANDEFYANIMPAAAVISVGADNSYGHPAGEVLEMLAKYDIKTLRTDQNGDIVFRTDGDQIFYRTQK